MQLAVSHDSLSFTRVADRTPFIPAGPTRQKIQGLGRGGIGFATIKKGRFVSLQTSFDGGGILTKPLKFAGSDLHVNAKSDSGEILVPDIFVLIGRRIGAKRNPP